MPIQLALSFPDRWEAPCAPTVWPELGSVEFADPDPETFGCLRLACAAGRAGGVHPCVLNAADEVAVAAFLADRIGYLDIEHVVEQTLGAFDPVRVESLEQLEQVDGQAREQAESWVRSLAR